MMSRYLTDADFPLLYKAFLEAFSDYVVTLQPTEEQFRDLLIRRGAQYAISPAAFDGDRLVGFHVNALDFYGGVLTLYDVSTGVVPSHRREGIASKLFEFSMPQIQQTGAKQYLLEVIQSNDRAVKAYEKAGFRFSRSFLCFRKSISEKSARSGMTFERGPFNMSLAESFCDWRPAWQNSFHSIARAPSMSVSLSGHRDGLVCYGIVFPVSGDIPQFAVHPDYRRKGIGTALLQELIHHVNAGTVRVMNVDASHRPTVNFLHSQGFEEFVTQYEMIRML